MQRSKFKEWSVPARGSARTSPWAFACPELMSKAVDALGEAPATAPLALVQSCSEITWGMVGWLGDGCDEEKETVLQGLYGLWIARNNARDRKRVQDAHEVSSSVCRYIDEWNAAI